MCICAVDKSPPLSQHWMIRRSTMLELRRWYRGMTMWRTRYSSSHKPPQSWSQLHHYQSLGSLGATSPLPVLESWSHFTPRILESLEPLRFSQSLGATSQSLGSLGATSPLSRVSESWDFTTPSLGQSWSYFTTPWVIVVFDVWHHSEVFEESLVTTPKSLKKSVTTPLRSLWRSLPPSRLGRSFEVSPPPPE